MIGRGRVAWWHWLPRRHYFIAASVSAADEIPDRLPRRAVVVVQQGPDLTWVAFDCPCTLRHRLLINLNARCRPHWRLESERRLTLHPSVDAREDGRRCHFWITSGRVRWTPNDERLG